MRVREQPITRRASLRSLRCCLRCAHGSSSAHSGRHACGLLMKNWGYVGHPTFFPQRCRRDWHQFCSLVTFSDEATRRGEVVVVDHYRQELSSSTPLCSYRGYIFSQSIFSPPEIVSSARTISGDVDLGSGLTLPSPSKTNGFLVS